MIIYQDSYNNDYYNSDHISSGRVIQTRNSKGVTSKRKAQRKVLKLKNCELLKRLGFTVKKSRKT